ncbi:DUF4132 domain-containing protein [Actinomadura mexicana]|uniref:Uncharacterized protein n=1 Tax=Actinomadura mexicana TaxID=134959 RepID=A0A239EGC4_9ACTN|nr:DUF4132 domain-containing protein [Actinomadura mexicana]SNS43491.1 protein of unknown function [Actinomadura mexicana]
MPDDALATEARPDDGPGAVQAMMARACESQEHGSRFALLLEEALPAAARLDAAALRELAPMLKQVNGRFARADVPIGYRQRVDRRLRALLASVDEAYLPEGVLPVHGTWAAPLRERARTAPSAELTRFVRHLASLSAPRPTRTWHRACVTLADEAAAREDVAESLRALAEDEPHCTREDGPHTDAACGYHHLVLPHHGDVARGVVWAAALTGGPEAVPRLQSLALRMGTSGRELYEGPKLAGAAINALGAVDDPRALEALWRLRAPIKNRALRKQLDTALQAAAERQGITRAQLVERTVPAHGLGPDGSVERTLGVHTVRLAVEDAATVRITFTGADGRASRTAPAAVKDGFPAELGQLKALAREVRATLSSERARVEGLMSQDRAWPYAEWCEHYRDHPVTGALVRGLIWEFQGDDGLWRASLAAPGGDAAHVRLWHPIRAAADDVRAWRERVADARVRQPFKQAFREIYLLTPAEQDTAAYSNRYAAHIVHYRRLYALFKERGWQANFLGRHYGGHDGEARGEFGGGEWRACLYHEPVDEADGAYEYAATDQVRFERRHGRRWREAPLADVPPPVFSEAMRDVDLFVGVTSIAADPDWADRGEDRHAAYRREAGSGPLTASAEVRRAALERILPRTRIAGRCALDGRHLVVRGELRTYRIHLGSANVLMEPDGAYLCIVQGRRAPGTLYLPFEDERLSLILSKAFLLAADHKITDASIRRQIGG